MAASLMQWKQLLSKRRISCRDLRSKLDKPDEFRSDFARDFDRILFSTSFRRLSDKTQVFPIPENDHVHSRLTHSVEVASIGRSIGTAVGHILLQKHSSELQKTHDKHDFGDIVASACLAHDIGNPPFGHSGEDSVKSFFVNMFGSDSALCDAAREREDFRNFDGNPQGFRILCRLQNEPSGGLQLTAATLSAFTKYPCEAGVDVKTEHKGSIYKKHGFFQSEKDMFKKIAHQVGLIKRPGRMEVYCRHPLAFLVEAADDISNTILDLEDAWRLKYVSSRQAFTLLRGIAKKAAGYDEPSDEKEKIVYLRGKAFAVLRREIVDAFFSVYGQIMSGKQTEPLIEIIESKNNIQAIQRFSRENIYTHKHVLEIELPGYKVLTGLLEELIPAVATEKPSKRHKKLLQLVSLNSLGDSNTQMRLYDKIMRATDYVVGMTDGYAISVYQRLKGMVINPTVR